MDDLQVGIVYADSHGDVIGKFIGVLQTFKNCFLQFKEFATGELYQVPASILILGLKKF